MSIFFKILSYIYKGVIGLINLIFSLIIALLLYLKGKKITFHEIYNNSIFNFFMKINLFKYIEERLERKKSKSFYIEKSEQIDTGMSIRERDRWRTYGFYHSSDIARWEPFSPQEAFTWRVAGIRYPFEADKWKNAGFSLKDLEELRNFGIKPFNITKLSTIFKNPNYILYVDTNFFMDIPIVLYKLAHKYNKKLYTNNHVYEEIINLIKSENIETSKKAKNALRNIEKLNDENLIVIEDIDIEHENMPYADKKFLESIEKKYLDRNQIVLLTSDRDLKIRFMQILKNKFPGLVNKFKVFALRDFYDEN